ncbi:hypothetical protein AAU01_00850 [Paenarthrobacter aurescens]|uniref:Uncharacterized protein n=1 Tax=Paenarthrobacter aurescens TaxID=43663 RepID=A0A4Y3N6F9_PAEAU|nr:hypothetical protein AAU01_00850 [Paenarthrobacter aurescens]
MRTAAYRRVGAVDRPAHCRNLGFGAVHHCVDVAQRGPEPVLRPLGKIAVVRNAMANPWVGDLQENCAARTGKKNTFRTNVCQSTNHLNTVAP